MFEPTKPKPEILTRRIWERLDRIISQYMPVIIVKK